MGMAGTLPQCGTGLRLSVVETLGPGLTDFAGVDNFSEPRRCSGGGGSFSRVRASRTTIAFAPQPWRRGVDAPRRDEKGSRRCPRSCSGRLAGRRCRDHRRLPDGHRGGSLVTMMSTEVRPPRNGSNSNDCSSNGTRNRRFNTVHATEFMKPSAAVVAGLTLRACARVCVLGVGGADSLSGRASSRSPSVFP